MGFRSRTWLFVAYVVAFVSLSGSVGLLVQDALQPATPSTWTGIAGVLQCCFVLARYSSSPFSIWPGKNSNFLLSELSFNSTGLLVRSPLFYIRTTLFGKFSVHACRWSFGSLNIRTFYIGFIEGQGQYSLWNKDWPSMNQNRYLFEKNLNAPLSMHHQQKQIVGIVCKTTNGDQLLRKSHIEFKG